MLTTNVAKVLLLVLSAPVWAGLDIEHSDEQHPTAKYSGQNDVRVAVAQEDPSVRALSKRIERAEADLQQGRTSDGLSTLEGVLKLQAPWWCEKVNGSFTDHCFYAEAVRALQQLTPAQKEIYESVYGKRAELEYLAALRSGDIQKLKYVAKAFRLTRAGDRALENVIVFFQTSGELGLAALYTRAKSDDPSKLDKFYPLDASVRWSDRQDRLRNEWVDALTFLGDRTAFSEIVGEAPPDASICDLINLPFIEKTGGKAPTVDTFLWGEWDKGISLDFEKLDYSNPGVSGYFRYDSRLGVDAHRELLSRISTKESAFKISQMMRRTDKSSSPYIFGRSILIQIGYRSKPARDEILANLHEFEKASLNIVFRGHDDEFISGLKPYLQSNDLGMRRWAYILMPRRQSTLPLFEKALTDDDDSIQRTARAAITVIKSQSRETR